MIAYENSGSYNFHQTIDKIVGPNRIVTLRFNTKKSSGLGYPTQNITLRASPTGSSVYGNLGTKTFSIGNTWKNQTLSWTTLGVYDKFKFEVSGAIYYNKSDIYNNSVLDVYYDNFQWDEDIPNTEIKNTGINIKFGPNNYLRVDSSSFDIQIEDMYINNMSGSNINVNQITSDTIVSNIVETINFSNGDGNSLEGSYNTALGRNNVVGGLYTTAIGYGIQTYEETVVQSIPGQTVVGRWNKTSGSYPGPEGMFIVGHGSADNDRADAFTVYDNGDSTVSHSLQVGWELNVTRSANIGSNLSVGNNITANGYVTASVYRGSFLETTQHCASILSSNNNEFFSFYDNTTISSVGANDCEYFKIVPYNGRLKKIQIYNTYAFGESLFSITKGTGGSYPNTTYTSSGIDLSSIGVHELDLSDSAIMFDDLNTIGLKFSGSIAPSVGSGENINITCIWEFIRNN